MNALQEIVRLWKRQRDSQALRRDSRGSYAFIGYGSHSQQNLYPVISYLRLPLKYIGCASAQKAALLRKRFPDIGITTRPADILSDPEVCGVFVAARPESHFALAQQVIGSGKSLFIEKPPCRTERELAALAEMAAQSPNACVMAGLQKRYAPAVQLLRRKLKASPPLHYALTWRTGRYPEGDALLELFIHPLDLLCHLFGPAELAGWQSARGTGGGITLQLLFRHGSAQGLAEISTAYSWNTAEELLTVNTRKGTFRLVPSESLVMVPAAGNVAGIPIEKLRPGQTASFTLFSRNSFTPTLRDNPVHTGGFFEEIRRFSEIAERRGGENLSPLGSLRPVYRLMQEIREKTGI